MPSDPRVSVTFELPQGTARPSQWSASKSTVAMGGIPLSAPQAELMGTIRLMQLTEKYGITSGAVLRAVVIWGELLDSVNHPPARCKNCPEPVVFDSQRAVYVHPGRPSMSDMYCLRSAGRTAEPKEIVNV